MITLRLSTAALALVAALATPTLATAAPPEKKIPAIILRSLPADIQKRIEEVRQNCREYETADKVTKGDEGLVTFTVSGKQAVLVDELNFCGNGQECFHSVNCATGFAHEVFIYVRTGRSWTKSFSVSASTPVVLDIKDRAFKRLNLMVFADDWGCPSSHVPHATCAAVVKWDGNRFTHKLVDEGATPAAAKQPELPSSMHGLWCHAGEQAGTTRRYVRGQCKRSDSDDFLEVGSAYVGGHEWGCDFRKVAVVGRTFKVSSKCGGEGMLSDEEATIWLDGRFLVYRVDQTTNERADYGTLVCANHKSSPPDSDADPVVRTILNFEDTFAVTHVARSGKAYVRGDQYKNVKVWYDEKGDHWSGVWKRNPNKRLTGTVTPEGNKYIEETYDGGRLETTVVSTCETKDDVR